MSNIVCQRKIDPNHLLYNPDMQKHAQHKLPSHHTEPTEVNQTNNLHKTKMKQK